MLVETNGKLISLRSPRLSVSPSELASMGLVPGLSRVTVSRLSVNLFLDRKSKYVPKVKGEQFLYISRSIKGKYNPGKLFQKGKTIPISFPFGIITEK